MSKITVGIIDDNVRTIHSMMEALKTDSDLEVVGTAEDGLKGLTLIEEKQPDVVLLDLIMPKLDGLGVMEKLKKNTALPKQPTVIVVSAISQERVMENAFELGAAYYILKPFDNETLHPASQRGISICVPGQPSGGRVSAADGEQRAQSGNRCDQHYPRDWSACAY